MNNKTPLLFLAALLIIGISATILSSKLKSEPQNDLSTACAEHQGTWLEEYQECEYPDDQEWCDEAGGTFKECESACRHDENAELCTLQCVPICTF